MCWKIKPRLYNILHVKDRNSVTEVCSSAWVTNEMQTEWRLAFHLQEGSGGANSWNSAAPAWRGLRKPSKHCLSQLASAWKEGTMVLQDQGAVVESKPTAGKDFWGRHKIIHTNMNIICYEAKYLSFVIFLYKQLGLRIEDYYTGIRFWVFPLAEIRLSSIRFDIFLLWNISYLLHPLSHKTSGFYC